jgi:hypothetical protein
MHPCGTRSSYHCIDERVRKDLPRDKIFSSAPAPPRDCISSSASSDPSDGEEKKRGRIRSSDELCRAVDWYHQKRSSPSRSRLGLDCLIEVWHTVLGEQSKDLKVIGFVERPNGS